MLNELTLENFQAFSQQVSVRFRPITLLIGPNNSGKSTVLRMLETIRYILIQTPDRVIPKLYGPPRNIHSPNLKSSFDLSISARDHPPFQLAGTFDLQQELQNCRVSLRIGGLNGEPPAYWDPDVASPDTAGITLDLQNTVIQSIQESMEALIPVPPENDGTMRFRQTLAQLSRDDPQALQFLIRQTQAITRAGCIQFDPLPGRTPNITSWEGLPLAALGMGSRNTLSIAAQACLAPRGSTIILENPEAGLDPSSRLEMGTLIANLYTERGISSIIETHSDEILLQFRFLAAQGRLPHQDISIAFFDPGPASPPSPQVRNIGVNPDGSLEPGLPMKFFGADVTRAIQMNAINRGNSHPEPNHEGT